METAQNTFNNGKLVKIIYRLKATKSFYAAKLYHAAGEKEKCARLCELSLWYHRQAFSMGYDSEAFMKDLDQLIALSGKKHALLLDMFLPAGVRNAA